jgi:hypothetical protein
MSTYLHFYVSEKANRFAQKALTYDAVSLVHIRFNHLPNSAIQQVQASLFHRMMRNLQLKEHLRCGDLDNDLPGYLLHKY